MVGALPRPGRRGAFPGHPAHRGPRAEALRRAGPARLHGLRHARRRRGHPRGRDPDPAQSTSGPSTATPTRPGADPVSRRSSSGCPPCAGCLDRRSVAGRSVGPATPHVDDLAHEPAVAAERQHVTDLTVQPCRGHVEDRRPGRRRVHGLTLIVPRRCRRRRRRRSTGLANRRTRARSRRGRRLRAKTPPSTRSSWVTARARRRCRGASGSWATWVTQLIVMRLRRPGAGAHHVQPDGHRPQDPAAQPVVVIGVAARRGRDRSPRAPG